VYNTSLEKEYEAERKPLNLLKEDLDKFYDWIKEKSLASQSTYLSAAIFYTSPRARNVALPGYEHLLDELQVKFKEVSDKKFNKKLNKKSEKENANWCTLKELNKIRIKYRNQLRRLGYQQKTKELKKPQHFDIILIYLIASLYLLHPPRRNIYANTKIIKAKEFLLLSQKQKEDNNYLVIESRNKKFFSFGDYKTAKFHGIMKIPVVKELNKVINMWLNFNNTRDFIITSKGKPMTENNLGRYLNLAFEATGKKIGCNMIRKIMCTEKCSSDEYKDLSITAKLMGHTVAIQQSTYVKT